MDEVKDIIRRKYLQNSKNKKPVKPKIKKPEYLYLQVTDDEYELPIIVADTVHDLARKAGVDVSTVRSSLWRHETGKLKFSKFRRVKYR